ncbi:MAG: sugar transferase [Rhodospirillaceae bacterium]|nr:sugar transferase [Rhodospirillaceae bacterium]
MLKRLFDFFASLAGLAVLAPVFIAVAIAIKLSSPGPVFFRQVRIGRRGKPFRIFKFRTMTGEEPTAGPILTIGANPRVTPVGEVLRLSKIDELPQLINVVLGHMSLVGPRPEVPKYVEKWTPAQREAVLAVRPGLTGPASVKFRNQEEILARYANPEQAYETIVMQEKLAINAAYIKQATFMSDLKLIFQTLGLLFWRD